MKIFICSKAHIPRMRAHLIPFSRNYQKVLVVDGVEQAKRAMDHCSPHYDDVAVANPPTGLGQATIAWVRDWVERELTQPGEWYGFLDDNVSHLTALCEPEYCKDKVDFDLDWRPGLDWRRDFESPVTPERLDHIVKETIAKAEEVGTSLVGFATETNYFYRSRKWQYLGYCRMQFGFAKNNGRGWIGHPGCMIEDFWRSIETVAREGKILVNRFLKPHKPFFEEGGIGSLEERRPNLEYDMVQFMERYPGLLRYNKGIKHHLKFVPTTLNSVNEWRYLNGYR